jgi:hypothetical protein
LGHIKKKSGEYAAESNYLAVTKPRDRKWAIQPNDGATGDFLRVRNVPNLYPERLIRALECNTDFVALN